MPTLLAKIKSANKGWFSAGNKRFFGDVRYYAYRSKTGKPYLVRATFAWSDMFGQEPKLTFRINNVDPNTLKIEHLIENVFETLEDAKHWVYIEGLAETIIEA